MLQTYVPSSQEEEDKLKKQLEEPAPPLSEVSQKCCPPDFDNILNSLLNSRDLENSINLDIYWSWIERCKNEHKTCMYCNQRHFWINLYQNVQTQNFESQGGTNVNGIALQILKALVGFYLGIIDHRAFCRGYRATSLLKAFHIKIL